MSLHPRSSVFATVLFASILGPRLAAQTNPPAPAAAQPYAPPQPHEMSDAEFRDLAHDMVLKSTEVSRIVDEGRVSEKTQILEPKISQILADGEKFEQGLTRTPSPPLKVRGGAMTVRTTAQPQQVSSDTYCVPLPYPQSTPLQLQYIPDPTVRNWPDEQDQSLSGTETIDLLGRDKKGNPGSDGIRLAFTNTCNGQFGVTIGPIVSGHKSFYEYKDHQTDEDGTTYIRRFQHWDCRRHLPAGDGDEDRCEQMSQIKIDGSHFADCKNGECFVQILQIPSTPQPPKP